MSEQDLAHAVIAGVDALRRGRPRRAVASLTRVAQDAALADSEELADVYARVCSLLGQALIEAGSPREALAWIRKARRTLRRLDPEAPGLRAIRSLQDRAIARLAQAADAEGPPLEALLGATSDPDDRASGLLAESQRAIDAGDPTHAGALAREALALGREHGRARATVLARITLARVESSEAGEHLLAAWKEADRADEPNLVTAVARAAELLGVPLPSQHGPMMGERR